MKAIKIITCLIFALIICIPLVKFNFQPNAISEIDNRNLAENPFLNSNGEDLTESIESYVNDRIGFRSDMINAYTVLNDKLFGKMVHPSYTYGKDGYVFGAGCTTENDRFTDFHKSFAEMVNEIQKYCEERNIPFLFVFDPAKPAVLSEYMAVGTNYSRAWAEEFLETVDNLGINYVDNTATLKKAHKQGEVVFNKKYDANHWNDLGAFHGVNAMLNNLKSSIPAIHINELSEFNIIQKLETSLPVSKFTINEKVPEFTLVNDKLEDLTNDYYAEIRLNPSYRAFGYYKNEQRELQSAPKALVFQGSYMNGMGYKFLQNSFSEYTYVHDYQNIFDFEYYYNIFKPDCVIFEVAEYTFLEQYFSYENMKNFKLQPTLASVKSASKETLNSQLSNGQITIEKGKTLTKIVWNTQEDVEYAWMTLGGECGMEKVENGYAVTIKTETYERYKNSIKITTFSNAVIKEYR